MPEEQSSADKEANDGSGVTFRNIQSKMKENGCTIETEGTQKPPLFYGGNTGALFFIIFGPIFVIVINLMCTKDSCTITKLPTIPTSLSTYFGFIPACIFLILSILTSAFHSIPLGSELLGEPQPNGKCLKYRMNGIWLIVLFIPMAITFFAIKLPIHLIHQNIISLIILNISLAFATSTCLYIRSFKAPKSELSIYGNTGNLFYDFFMGRELNPRIGDIDIKIFCIRFGFGTWAAYDLSLIWSQWHQYGAVNTSLLLALLGSVLYILDYFIFEETMLTTFTVNHQGTGFLLVFGSIVFVPFFYSLPSRFMLEHNHSLSEPMLIIIFCCLGLSHVFYRLANADKVMFIRNPDDPDVVNYDYIEADNGKFLLVDGWWAVVRHPNYIADMLMALSWCLTTGFNDGISYTYFVFNVLFNLHLIRQNEDMCKREFGKAWDIYCQRVKYKLIKYIY